MLQSQCELLIAADLLQVELGIGVSVDRLRRRLRHRSYPEVLDLTQLLDAPLYDDALLAHTQIVQEFVRNTELVVNMVSEKASGVHLWQVLEAIEVIGLLMGHLGQKSSPEPLVKVRVLDAPADRAKGLPVVLALANCQRVAATACVADDGRCHAGAEAGHAIVFSVEGVLHGVVLRRV